MTPALSQERANSVAVLPQTTLNCLNKAPFNPRSFLDHNWSAQHLAGRSPKDIHKEKLEISIYMLILALTGKIEV